MSRWGKYLFFALLWVAAIAYVIGAACRAREVRSGQRVQALEICVEDSTSQGYLVASNSVREWISNNGIPTINEPVDSLRLTDIEELISRNGFVDRVVARVNYDGVLRINISQHRPVLRLLTDGMNSYTTSEGVVFVAPKGVSRYVPVVTGSYRPPFPANYEGTVRDYIDRELARIDRRIEELEQEKFPFYKRSLKNDENLRELRRKRIKRRWWAFESREKFEERVKELRLYKEQRRRDFRYEARLIREGIEAVERQQAAQRSVQKKLEKNYEDFMKLLTFVEHVENNDFWRSEVVQIVARTAHSGALEIDLIPRSGQYTICFGRIEQVEEKLNKLLRFYRQGLSRIGWDTYRVIDVRFDKQVVCRK